MCLAVWNGRNDEDSVRTEVRSDTEIDPEDAARSVFGVIGSAKYDERAIRSETATV